LSINDQLVHKFRDDLVKIYEIARNGNQRYIFELINIKLHITARNPVCCKVILEISTKRSASVVRDFCYSLQNFDFLTYAVLIGRFAYYSVCVGLS